MPLDVPPGFRNGFLSEILGGKIARIHLVKEGSLIASIDCDGRGLGGSAALLLSAAQEISPFLGRMAPSNMGAAFTETPVAATSVALSSNPDPALSTLVVRVGEATVGFAIPTESLAEIGQSFLAASATGRWQ